MFLDSIVKYFCITFAVLSVINFVQVSAQQDSTQTSGIPNGIDPSQTSKDPTYAYTKENPVKLGSEFEMMGPNLSKYYLRHLLDKNFKPFEFRRIGNVGKGEDGHVIDVYELTDSEGDKYDIYIDMYHKDKLPSQCKAPEGMYSWWPGRIDTSIQLKKESISNDVRELIDENKNVQEVEKQSTTVNRFTIEITKGKYKIITDHKTELQWIHLWPTKSPSESVSIANSSKYSGFSDWRIPSITELSTLYDDTYDANIDSIFEPVIWGVWSSEWFFKLYEEVPWCFDFEYYIAYQDALSYDVFPAGSRLRIREHQLIAVRTPKDVPPKNQIRTKSLLEWMGIDGIGYVVSEDKWRGLKHERFSDAGSLSAVFDFKNKNLYVRWLVCVETGNEKIYNISGGVIEVKMNKIILLAESVS